MKSTPILFVLLTAVVTMASAQQLPDKSPDKEAVFHFHNGSSVFIFPGKYNEELFKSVCDYIDAHRKLIDDGSMPIYVYGYCGTSGNQTERAHRVGMMSNYVKGEFIHARRAVESNFITKNSTEPYSSEMPNAVVLKFVLPPKTVTTEVKPKVEPQVTEVPKQTESKPQVEGTPKEESKVVVAQTPAETTISITTKVANPYKLAVRTNLLHWLAATPNLGVEWRPTSVFSILVDADYAPWQWNDKLNYYRIWNIQPQVRFYMLPSRKLYVGGEFHAGELNWKIKTKGTQGDFIGGGIVMGYQLRLNRSLDLDFNIGAGYTSYKYDKYKDIDGFLYPYEKGLKKNYWGLSSAGVSLIWKICK